MIKEPRLPDISFTFEFGRTLIIWHPEAGWLSPAGVPFAYFAFVPLWCLFLLAAFRLWLCGVVPASSRLAIARSVAMT